MKLRNLLSCSANGTTSADYYKKVTGSRPRSRSRPRPSNSRFYDGTDTDIDVPSSTTELAQSRPSSSPEQMQELLLGSRVVWIREPNASNEAGVVRWLGQISGEDIAGIEFDRKLHLGSGWYRNHQLFTCRKDHGGLVAVIGLLLENDLYRTQETMPGSSGVLLQPPLREDDVERIAGRLKGIQGHRNSCYLDATLFSMFSFSSVFDSILVDDVSWRHGLDNSTAREVQRIMREDIVNPLRKELLTPADNVMHLRETMLHLDDKLTSEEMDPQEFLEILFRNVLHLEGFLHLSSGQSDYSHQVLVKGDAEKIPTVQQLLEESLYEQVLKFKTIPTPALILQMPRSGNKFKMFKGILPNLTIDITDVLEDTPRMCTICGSLATHECRACYGKFTDRGGLCSGADSTAFCTDCLSRVHSRSDRSAHSAHFTPLSNSFNLDNTNTAKGEFPRLTMDLFAVICIETSHFVSFVKCGTDRLAPWVFFDSMADRVEVLHGTGHNVPQVKVLPKMSTWLDHLEQHPTLLPETLESVTPELKRLIADPYICLYYSPQAVMYS